MIYEFSRRDGSKLKIDVTIDEARLARHMAETIVRKYATEASIASGAVVAIVVGA